MAAHRFHPASLVVRQGNMTGYRRDLEPVDYGISYTQFRHQGSQHSLQTGRPRRPLLQVSKILPYYVLPATENSHVATARDINLYDIGTNLSQRNNWGERTVNARLCYQ